MWIGPKLSTCSEKKYRSAGAVTVDVPWVGSTLDSWLYLLFLFLTVVAVHLVLNWPVFLAFLAELLEFVVPLKSVHPIVEDLLSVLGTTSSSWCLLASQAWTSVLGMSGNSQECCG